MEAQIHTIATALGRVLINPIVLMATVTLVLALVSGVAARLTFVVEELLQVRTSRRGGPCICRGIEQDARCCPVS